MPSMNRKSLTRRGEQILTSQTIDHISARGLHFSIIQDLKVYAPFPHLMKKIRKAAKVHTPMTHHSPSIQIPPSGSGGTSVVDPWHFGTDPDPQIRTTDLRMRILLFLSVTFKFFYFLLFEYTLHQSSRQNVIKQYKSRFFLLFLLDDGRIRIRTNIDGSGSLRSKSIRILRIRIHITG